MITTWQPYWPINMDDSKQFRNFRKFCDHLIANDLIFMSCIWGAVGMKPDGKIMAYFKPPKPLHEFGRNND